MAAAAPAPAPATSRPSLSTPERMLLPPSAVDALTLPTNALYLELSLISFSHYCARAKWYLGACGVHVDAVHKLLPMQHLPFIFALLKKFKARRCAATASSNSPAATPVLAVFRTRAREESGASSSILEPLFLLQDSELIGRWAALRAQALGDGGRAARALYGEGAELKAVVGPEGEEAAAEGDEKKQRRTAAAVLTYSPSCTSSFSPTPAELERRLSGAMGVESRRLAYFHLLPARALLMRTFALNLPSDNSGFFARRIVAPLWALAASLALPRLLGINRAAVERGAARLGAEFDYLDALIRQRGCLVEGKEEEGDRVGAFLCSGGGPSAADVSLATLAAPLVGDVRGYGAHLPLVREMPEGLRRAVLEQYAHRPTARYVRALWREYGAAAIAAATTTTTRARL